MRRLLPLSLALLAHSAYVTAQSADADLDRLRAELVASWVVDVESEPRTRTLNLRSLRREPDGSLVVDATYGWSDGNQTPVKTQLVVSSGSIRMSLVTQARSQVSVERQPDGQFVGLFKWESGQVRPVVLTRVAEGQAVASQAYRVVLPAADVPAACAALSGVWTGNWSFGQRWLWVIQVDRDCKAMYSYGPERPRALKAAQIVDGTLQFQCGTSGGVCSFWRSGSDLYGRYSGSDGMNNTVFTADQRNSSERRQ